MRRIGLAVVLICGLVAAPRAAEAQPRAPGLNSYLAIVRICPRISPPGDGAVWTFA